ncbi:hypothetical protein [Chryseobacterium sp.]|uniref:hypothetical protein n=1 Tax=Chryseobacterium sp. TaxID=1871047 RepID=UPI0031DC177F
MCNLNYFIKSEALNFGNNAQKIIFLDAEKGKLVLPDIGEIKQEEYLWFTKIQNKAITGMTHFRQKREWLGMTVN